MTKVLIVFFSVLLVMVISIIPFKIRLMGHFNIFELKGYYCFKVLFFKFLNGRITMQNDGLKMENSVNFMDGYYNGNFLKELSKQIIKRIDIKKIEVFFTGGVSNDSFTSAIMCGSVSSVVETVFGILTQKYEGIKLYKDISPTFNENNLELTFDGVISISLLAIFLSVLATIFKSNKKERKNEG